GGDTARCALVVSAVRDIWAHCLTSATWTWSNLGQPPDFNFELQAAAQPKGSGLATVNLAAIAENGTVWWKWFAPGGKASRWSSLGHPEKGTQFVGLAVLGDPGCPRLDFYEMSYD